MLNSFFERIDAAKGKNKTQQQQPASSQPERNQAVDEFFARFDTQPKKSKTGEDQPVAVVNNELPKNALGFDEAGNPYFGDTIKGILNKWVYNYTKDVEDVSADDWRDLRDRWRASTSKKGVSQGEWVGEQLNQIGMMGEAIGKVWQEGTKDDSLLSAPLKFVGATTSAVFDLFGIPAKRLEQGLGALQGFREAAGEIESPLPKLDGWAENAIYSNPLFGTAYDFTRIVFSDSENKWTKVGKAVREGWHAGRIYYSQLFDQTLKEKFLAEYRAGEDPELLQLKYENPLAELGGQFVFDPTIVLGKFNKASRAAKQLNRVIEAVGDGGVLRIESGKAALKAIQEATDPRSAIKALEQLQAAQAEVVQNVVKKSKILNVGYSADALTTTSRQNAVVSKGKDLLGVMVNTLRANGMSYDAVAKAILNGVQSVSSNVDEMRAGLAGLADLPKANMWLNEDYVETFVVLNRMMSNADGIVDGGKLRKLLDVKNPTEFADEVQRLFARAAEGQFHEVNDLKKAFDLAEEARKTGGIVTKETEDMAKLYEQLPDHVKFLNGVNNAIEKVTGPINKYLFPSYFNLQGGVAVRNVISNLELTLIDKPSSFWKDGKYWTDANVQKFLTDVFGELPTSAKGFESLVQSATGRKAWGFGKLMEKGEEWFARRIVAGSVRDTFKKMLPKAMPDLVKDMEAGTITERQVKMFQSLLSKHNYNVTKAVEEFRDIYKVGAIEDWRNLDHVTDFEKNALQEFDLWQDIEQLAHKGAKSLDEVEQVFAKLNEVIDNRAAHVLDDPVGISPDHPGIESWGDLAKAADEGLIDFDKQQHFTAVMEIAEQARIEYQTLLDDLALKAQQALNRQGRLNEATAIGQELNRINKTLRKSAPVTAREAHAITQDAWRWTEEIKKLKRPKREDLIAYWTRAGLEGDPPLDLNRKTLLKAIWENRHTKVADLWNSSFDAVVGESETILKQLEKVIDTAELQSMASRTRFLTQQAQAIRQGAYHNGALKIVTKEEIEKVAKKFNVTVDEILTAINNETGKVYASIDDVPTQDLMNVIKKAYNTDIGIKIPPPHPMGTAPSLPRAWHESARGLKYVLDNVKNGIIERWGRTNAERVMSPELEGVLQKITTSLEEKIPEIKAMALKIAEEDRKFTLLDYNDKRYIDIALAKVWPFHFFYTRSYKNWIYRIAEHPDLVANYGRLRTELEQINKDAPDWYKHQLDITKPLEWLGIQVDHPIYMNLESTFNPLYGLTGTDYYDPVKRTNWTTATIDDMSKFGPSIYAPIQLGIAALLFHQGDTEAAAHWTSRLFPQTAQFKALTATLFDKPVELDPAVMFFAGGMTTQERNRMAYSAAQLIASGQFTPEEIMNQFAAQSGPAWDAAYNMAIESTAASSFVSYFLGTGFKARTENDVMVEGMTQKLSKLFAQSDYMDSEKFRMEFERIRSEYPDGFLDTYLLAKKGGAERDAALAYNVLGRIPPGRADDVLAAIGLSQKEIDKFYKSKGFTDKSVKFSQGERDRFMSGILDLAAMLKIPTAATREEWLEVRSLNSQIYKDLEAEFGEDIWDKVSHYYDLKDDNRQAADQFAALHPEVFEAMFRKREAIVSNPLLNAYYGGLETIEIYIDGKVRHELTEKFGYDIYQKQTEYYNQPSVAAQRSYLKQHPELKRFWNLKRTLERQYEPLFYQFASVIPERKDVEFQEGFTPESYTQEQLYEALQPDDVIPSWEEVSQGMQPWLVTEIEEFAATGRPLSRRAQKQLDYLADTGNYYNADQLLRYAVLALQRPVAESPVQEQTPSAVDQFFSRFAP